MREIRFVDICNALNVHAFIIWEFIKRYGYENGVRKDKFGRGYVQTQECSKWLAGFVDYLKFQEYSYKQDINKGQYTYRDKDRFQREKESEADIVRIVSSDGDGNITRLLLFKNKSKGLEHWDAVECVWRKVLPKPLF